VTIDATPILRLSPVIPVVTLTNAEDAPAVGKALLAGGLTVIEVTLRSAAGLAAIEALRTHCTGLCVGAGTVWTEAQAYAAAAAGAEFMVSPGIADPVFDVCDAERIAYLPGAQTVSEVAHHVSRGTKVVKFFPASTSGGPAALRAFSAVFPETLFCPTGGITLESARSYLALGCVPCIGGGWLTPKAVIESRDWAAIETAAAEAAALAAD
jgi:2-dehydro-3-deoxyphosphogluconate aldolase / (4S)-4-hydroxy-2-oxoglutarate aldolase